MRLPLFPDKIRWGIALLAFGIIVYYSLFTTPSAPGQAGPFWDKKLHFLAYAGLTLSFAYATVSYRSQPLYRITGVLLGAIAIGALIELLQAPLPVRQMSGLDFLANVIGALLASLWFLFEPHVTYERLGLPGVDIGD